MFQVELAISVVIDICGFTHARKLPISGRWAMHLWHRSGLLITPNTRLALLLDLAFARATESFTAWLKFPRRRRRACYHPLSRQHFSCAALSISSPPPARKPPPTLLWPIGNRSFARLAAVLRASLPRGGVALLSHLALSLWRAFAALQDRRVLFTRHSIGAVGRLSHNPSVGVGSL